MTRTRTRTRARTVLARLSFYHMANQQRFQDQDQDQNHDQVQDQDQDEDQSQDNNPTGSTWGTVPFFDNQGNFAHLPRSTNLSPKWSYWKRESNTAFANLEQRFGDD